MDRTLRTLGGQTQPLPIASYFSGQSRALTAGIIVLAVSLAAALYLWASPIEFPMDDAYIHFVYADHLAWQGGLYFNDPAERGVGTSSLLWVVLLAAGSRLGLSLHVLAKVLGLASLAVVGVAGHALLRGVVAPRRALLAMLALVLSGHMLWFALNGMETMLFLALGVCALWFYRHERWAWLGLLLGLLVLTRVEGAALAAAVAAVDVWRRRGLRRGLAFALALCALLAGGWLAYLYLRTGHFLPTSGLGKHFAGVTAIQIAAASRPDLAWLTFFPALAYPVALVPYLLEFALGGASLPPPFITIPSGVGSITIQISVWAVAGWALVVAPLAALAGRAALRTLRQPALLRADDFGALLVLFVWSALHNLCYMAYLPSIGHASRYAAVVHLWLWPALVLAVPAVRSRALRPWLAAGLAAIALLNTVYWNRVYDANLEHMVKVRRAATAWLPHAFEQSATCAASDIGAVRYYSQRTIIDLGGLIDPDLSAWYLRGELDRYLVEHGVTCLVLPGRAGSDSDGFYDVAKELGLSDSTLFTLTPAAEFQINRERWLLGYLPVVNYQARVTVYRLNTPP